MLDKPNTGNLFCFRHARCMTHPADPAAFRLDKIIPALPPKHYKNSVLILTVPLTNSQSPHISTILNIVFAPCSAPLSHLSLPSSDASCSPYPACNYSGSRSISTAAQSEPELCCSLGLLARASTPSFLLPRSSALSALPRCQLAPRFVDSSGQCTPSTLLSLSRVLPYARRPFESASKIVSVSLAG